MKMVKSANIRPESVNRTNDAKSVLFKPFDSETGKSLAEVQIELYGLDLNKGKADGLTAQGKAMTAFRAALAAYAIAEKVTGVVAKALCFDGAAEAYHKTVAAETAVAVLSSTKRAEDKAAEAAENSMRAVYVASGASEYMGLCDYLVARMGGKMDDTRRIAAAAAEKELTASIKSFEDSLTAFREHNARAAEAESSLKTAREELKHAKDGELIISAAFVRALYGNKLTEAPNKAAAAEVAKAAAAAAEKAAAVKKESRKRN